MRRRHFISGLLAAPALIGRADAGMRGALTARTVNNTLVKPTGTPVLDSGNAQNTSNLFVVFDTGVGAGSYVILQDCSPGHLIYPPNTYPTAWNPSALPSVTTLPSYGTGFKHAGGGFNTTMAGFNSFVADTDAIRTAHNLASQGTGAALCIEAVFVPHAVPDVSVGVAVVFGRTARGFTESTPRASVVFGFTNAGKARLYFKTNATDPSTGEPVTVDSAVLSLDTYHHLLATFYNDSAGSATMRFYVDGVQVATSSGHGLTDTFGNENDEGQVMMANSPHLFANHGDNYLDGHMFMGVYQTRAPDATEVASRAAAPYARFV